MHQIPNHEIYQENQRGSKKATVQNPDNLIEGMAREGWVRGGISSRELTRDVNYSASAN